MCEVCAYSPLVVAMDDSSNYIERLIVSTVLQQWARPSAELIASGKLGEKDFSKKIDELSEKELENIRSLRFWVYGDLDAAASLRHLKDMRGVAYAYTLRELEAKIGLLGRD